MSENNPFLEELHVKNFLSLRDVHLPLKPLTILVGANASGKSNILSSLTLLHNMVADEELPTRDEIQAALWAGGASVIEWQLKVKIGQQRASYSVQLGPISRIRYEALDVGSIQVISVQNGRGEVRDEDDATNVTPYHPKTAKLALSSAGDYGGRPITGALNQFIMGWEFYDFQPQKMRESNVNLLTKILGYTPTILSSKMDHQGQLLHALLADWCQNHEELFESVSDTLYASTGLKLDKRLKEGEVELFLQEGYKEAIPLKKASDGTMRLLAYYTLLNQPELPSLIAIEEPERNLHPAALRHIANVLEQLAEQTQVIITTHSPQLLDLFTQESLAHNLGILLLRNILGSGTEVININEARKNRAAFDGWIEDFGIGSAIFESELLQDLVEI